MLTLEQYNQSMKQFAEVLRNQRKAGVACDKCGTEMCYESDSMLLSNPPKQAVRCPSCGERGLKVGL